MTATNDDPFSSDDLTPDQFVGERVHFLMRRRGLSQRALAAQLGITQASVSNKVLGQRQWTISDLVLWASVLGVTVEQMVAGVPMNAETATVSDDGRSLLPNLDSNQEPSD